MQSISIIPWDKYALITELSIRFKKNKNAQFGKTIFQKIIFILQEVYNIPLGYDFSLYTYGPYASEVFQDLDFVESLKGVQIIPVETGYGGYKIIPGKEHSIIRAKGKEYLESDSVRKALNSLIKEFGGFTARDLELRATIIFIDRDLKGTPQHLLDDIAKLVHEIKPKFAIAEITKVIEEMSKKGYVLSR